MAWEIRQIMLRVALDGKDGSMGACSEKTPRVEARRDATSPLVMLFIDDDNDDLW